MSFNPSASILLQTLLVLYHDALVVPADGHSTTVYEPRRELGIGTSGIGTMDGAEAHDRLSISFEKPVLVGSSSTTSFYFPAAIQRLSAKGDTRGPLIVPISHGKVQVPAAQDTPRKSAGIRYTLYTKPAHKTSVKDTNHSLSDF